MAPRASDWRHRDHVPGQHAARHDARRRALTAYNVAFTNLQIPIGIIGVPLGTCSCRRSTRRGPGRDRRVGQLITRALRLLLYVMLFLTAVLIAIRVQLVGPLSYGKFDLAAIDLTTDASLFFLSGLAGHSLIVVLARAFDAAKARPRR